jgi:hypothetical protein
MHQAKKGNHRYCGMTAHIETDAADLGLVHGVIGIPFRSGETATHFYAPPLRPAFPDHALPVLVPWLPHFFGARH